MDLNTGNKALIVKHEAIYGGPEPGQRLYKSGGRFHLGDGRPIPEDAQECAKLGIWIPPEVAGIFQQRKLRREEAAKSFTSDKQLAKTPPEMMFNKNMKSLGEILESKNNVKKTTHRGIIFKEVTQ